MQNFEQFLFSGPPLGSKLCWPAPDQNPGSARGTYLILVVNVVEEPVTTPAPVDGLCPEGWTPFGSTCFHLETGFTHSWDGKSGYRVPNMDTGSQTWIQGPEHGPCAEHGYRVPTGS